ncbi:MAG: hypothetical protein OXC38_05355 [Gammaproteobacteria bacterium]|nr:hypothetical protein [Gammaproteobacteria bacterium]
MSEYKYYAFLAIDRPIDAAAMKKLRAVSSRAQITPVSFVNHYEWGDFHGNIGKMMEHWFDLHLYFANWGSRRLMMKFPRQLVDTAPLDGLKIATDAVKVRERGEALIVDVCLDEMSDDDDDDYLDKVSNWLGELAPLREDVLSGDSRAFYLLWLLAVGEGGLRDDAVEPLPGVGPITKPLNAFADFLNLDPGLVRAAAETGSGGSYELSASRIRQFVSALPKTKKEECLCSLIEGKPHALAGVQAKIREAAALKAGKARDTRRTAGELRARAEEIGER